MALKVSVVVAHPDRGSFNHAIARTAGSHYATEVDGRPG